LKTIHREIIKGQKYFRCPIGQLELWLIDLELMTLSYNAALPSLDLFGTEKDFEFMKLASIVLQLRTALLQQGLPAAIDVVDQHEYLLYDLLTRDEIERLRIEKENYDAGRLMEIGLKTGRYIDVLSIAKMVHNYECRKQARAEEMRAAERHHPSFAGSSYTLGGAAATTTGGAGAGALADIKRASRRAAQSVRPVNYDQYEDEDEDDDEDNKVVVGMQRRSGFLSAQGQQQGQEQGYDYHGQNRSKASSAAAKKSGGKRRSMQVEDGTASEEFIEGVLRSINQLNRAIAIANQVCPKLCCIFQTPPIFFSSVYYL
jgi:hypothetical protein